MQPCCRSTSSTGSPAHGNSCLQTSSAAINQLLIFAVTCMCCACLALPKHECLLMSCVLHRFQKALESAKHDEDMWVLLANANVHDAKARKVSSTCSSSSRSSSRAATAAAAAAAAAHVAAGAKVICAAAVTVAVEWCSWLEQHTANYSAPVVYRLLFSIQSCCGPWFPCVVHLPPTARPCCCSCLRR